jgi:hypothetical protein
MWLFLILETDSEEDNIYGHLNDHEQCFDEDATETCISESESEGDEEKKMKSAVQWEKRCIRQARNVCSPGRNELQGHYIMKEREKKEVRDDISAKKLQFRGGGGMWCHKLRKQHKTW